MPKRVSDAQMKVEEILRSVGKGGSGAVPQSVINEILQIIGASKKNPMTKALLSNGAVRAILKVKLMDLGPDEWKKKAAISAMLLSRSLNGDDE